MVLKKSIEKFPITILTIMLYTLIYTINMKNDLILGLLTIEHIWIFTIIFVSGTFLLETVSKKKLKNNILYYVIIAFFALIITSMTELINDIFGMKNSIFLFRLERFIICYVVVSIILGIYYNYKKSNMKFEEYLTKTVVGLFKVFLIYIALSIGLAIITTVFIYLFLNNKYYESNFILKVEILLLGIYYIPACIYCFSNQEEIVEKFIKIFIKYVLGTLVIISFAIIYMYIIKIIILKDMPSNQIFRILSALFIIGLPIWTMSLYFKENSIIDKIFIKLPFLFIPFIFLQIYSIGIRIIENGITEPRYMCVMLIIFEIIYIILFWKNKIKIGNMLIVFAIFTIISMIVPYINMFEISSISQYNNLKIYKQKTQYTQEDMSKIEGAYSFLKNSKEGKKYINEYLTKDEQEEIMNFKSNTYIEDSSIESIYLNKNIKFIEVDGYKKLYYIDIDKDYSKNKTIEEIFSNITFIVQDNNKKINVNMLDLVKSYIKQKDSDYLQEYFKKFNEIVIDGDKKIILESLSLEYDSITNEVEYYNIHGYLLEK